MSGTVHDGVSPLLESVLDELGMDIVSGTVPIGTTFTLKDLEDRFTISRTVAREAMRALEQLGLARSSRRVGITIQPRQNWDVLSRSIIDWRLRLDTERAKALQSLNELRRGLEPQAARLAAVHATDSQKEKFKELSNQLFRLGTSGKGHSDEFLQADSEFHTLLLLSSGNEIFIHLAPILVDVLRARSIFGLQPENPASGPLRAHQDLAIAISRGDAPQAEKSARIILMEVDETLK